MEAVFHPIWRVNLLSLLLLTNISILSFQVFSVRGFPVSSSTLKHVNEPVSLVNSGTSNTPRFNCDDFKLVEEFYQILLKTAAKSSYKFIMKERDIVSRKFRKCVHLKTWMLRKGSHQKSKEKNVRTGRKLLNLHEQELTADEFEDMADTLFKAVENNEEDKKPYMNSLGAALSDDLIESEDELDESAVFEQNDIEIPDNVMMFREIIKKQERAANIAMSKLKPEYRVSELLTDDREKIVVSRNYSAIGMGPKRKLLGLVVINSVWGEWTSWSKCSAECGSGGFTVRRRICETAPDVPCEDVSFDVRSCNVGVKCEVYVFLSNIHRLGIWGPCSTTCGDGIRARNRVCVTDVKGLRCRGVSSLLQRCKIQKCGVPEPVSAEPSESILKSIAAAGFHAIAVPLTYYLPHSIVNSAADDNNVVPPSYVVPEAPLIAPPKYKGKQSSPSSPYLWATWGQWSICSSHCDEGTRTRQRLCIDNSQYTPIKVMNKWCGAGTDQETFGCVGSCGNLVQHADENRMPSKVKVVETGDGIGPHIITIHEPGKEMKISRAEVIETGSMNGPDVITSHKYDKQGSLAKIEVIETGNGNGPIVETEHDTDTDNEIYTAETPSLPVKDIGDSKLTVEPIVFIVVFLVCILLLIVAFCVYFYQRVQESRRLRQQLEMQPFYKQQHDDEEEEAGHLVNGVVKPIATSAQFNGRSVSISKSRRIKAQRENKMLKMQNKKKRLRKI